MRLFAFAILACGLIGSGAPALANGDDEKLFHGLYLGAEAGVSDRGASFYQGFVGNRYRFDNNVVVGAEAAYGHLGVIDYSRTTRANPEDIWSVGGYIGLVFDDKNLITAGASYYELDSTLFQTQIRQNVGRSLNSSIRADLRYERSLTEHLNLRIQSSILDTAFSDTYILTGGLTFDF